MEKIEVKKIIRKQKIADTFCGLYSFSPYRGCLHDCKYCDGRAEKYHVEGVFHKDIVVRSNTIECLEKELPKLREYGPVSLQSGVSDIYQQVEKKELLTRRSLELISDYDFPIILHTKSNLLLRDLDILKKINEKQKVIVMISFTYLDENIHKKLEPLAASPKEKIEAISELKENGISVGTLAMPFIPHLTDNQKDISSLVKLFLDLDVDFAYIGGLTLKVGKQKQYFLDFIKNDYPELLSKIIPIFRNANHYGMPMQSYSNKLYSMLSREFSSIPFAIPHKIYKGIFAEYDVIQLLLKDMISLYRFQGIDVTRLKILRNSYLYWLNEKRKQISRSRKRSFSEIDQELENLFLTDFIETIIPNKKLVNFLRKVLFNNYTFDYLSLKLEKMEES